MWESLKANINIAKILEEKGTEVDYLTPAKEKKKGFL